MTDVMVTVRCSVCKSGHTFMSVSIDEDDLINVSDLFGELRDDEGWIDGADGLVCPDCVSAAESKCPFEPCEDHDSCMICLVDEALDGHHAT